MKFEKQLSELLNITLSDEQKKQFEDYYQYLIDYNRITNLTRITQKQDVYYKHFFDSLTLSRSIKLNSIDNMCDMGAGAGFPSLPLKIAFPHLKITIVESLGKRTVFLKELINKLNLSQVEIYNQRVEDFSRLHTQSFDLVTARAFGGLRTMLEMAIPMLKKDGYFIAMKASGYAEEIEQATHAFKTLKSQIEDIDTFQLPDDYGFRSNIKIKKNSHVEGYPRNYSQISKKPL